MAIHVQSNHSEARKGDASVTKSTPEASDDNHTVHTAASMGQHSRTTLGFKNVVPIALLLYTFTELVFYVPKNPAMFDKVTWARKKIGVLQNITSELPFPSENALTEFVYGPAAPYYTTSGNGTAQEMIFPMINETQAVCEFRDENWSGHFPHAMQQLLRCFSWWQANLSLIHI